RARMFLGNPNDIATDLEGHRLLTAGFHSQMGYFRDDKPLYDLVLDDAQRRELDTLWWELDFIAQVPERQLREFVWFERAEPRSRCSSRPCSISPGAPRADRSRQPSRRACSRSIAPCAPRNSATRTRFATASSAC